MPVYRNGEFIEDDWAPAGETLPATGRVFLSKQRYLDERAGLAGYNAPLGLILQPGETLEGLEQEIGRFSLVVLNISKFSDGRLYSIARLLRERCGYAGELRAAGDILRDQLAFLYRAGVDSFDVSNSDLIDALNRKAIVASRKHYQIASREKSEDKAAHSPRARLSETGQLPGVKP